MSLYIRQITAKIKENARFFPVISVTGPRQSGKTTLIKSLFPKYDYHNLEIPSVLARMEDDPLGVLKSHIKQGIIIDEVQRFPALLSYIQGVVDEFLLMGKVIISGSQNLLISEKVTQSLAGRVATIHLYPLSVGELKQNKQPIIDLKKLIFNGFYPAIYDRKVPATNYYGQYVETYLERDVKQLKDIGNLSQFHKFLVLVAARVGQVLNQASLAADVGVSAPTIESWLSVLEASFVVFRLPPFFTNIGKRLIKSPKIYFYDTGLLCFLLGIKDQETLDHHYLFGNLFENLVMSELIKILSNTDSPYDLYYVRDSNGNEVDALLVKALSQIAIEIKASATYRADFSKGLKFWQSQSSEVTKSAIIYTGKTENTGGLGQLLNWLDLSKLIG